MQNFCPALIGVSQDGQLDMIADRTGQGLVLVG
jgi:hypothetical protein